MIEFLIKVPYKFFLLGIVKNIKNKSIVHNFFFLDIIG